MIDMAPVPYAETTTLCAHVIDGGTLTCTREPHTGPGHVYATGSWVPDRHGSSS